MKIFKLSIEGLQNFKNNLEIDFVAQQRVDDDRIQMFNVFSNVSISPAISFIGINASGKTTILKLISFFIGLLNNQPINSISSKEFLYDLNIKKYIIFTAYFYHNDVIYKLETIVGKKINSIDSSTKLVIIDETLWSKEICKVKTKKGLYDFTDVEMKGRRDKDEQYLMEDVSIIVALNKKQNANFFQSSLEILLLPSCTAFSFQWHITDECSQRCKHCYIYSAGKRRCLLSMTWIIDKRKVQVLERIFIF